MYIYRNSLGRIKSLNEDYVLDNVVFSDYLCNLLSLRDYDNWPVDKLDAGFSVKYVPLLTIE